MKYAFLASTIIELIGGIVTYFYPELIFDEAHYLGKMYGIIAVTLGVISLYCFLHYAENIFFRKIFLTLMGFHAIIAFTCYSIPVEVWSLQLGGTLTHLGVFVFFVMAYLKDVKPDTE